MDGMVATIFVSCTNIFVGTTGHSTPAVLRTEVGSESGNICIYVNMYMLIFS